ncbi:MAG: glycosyltransferase [Bacteroidales bacterium]|nr:glycosyltransferase [Bacteroidales bacterium]
MKRVLIITYYWPPSGGAGVQRWLKLARYLPSFGIEPVILTVDPDHATYPVTDYSLTEAIPQDLKVYTTAATDYFRLLSRNKAIIPSAGFAKTGKRPLLNKLARFARGNFFIPDPRKGWNNHAYRKACEIIDNLGITDIITTSPPHSTQLIGLRLKKRYTNLNWIADLRDPWTDIYYYSEFYPTPIARAIDRKLEKKVILRADKLVAVGESLAGLFDTRYPGVRDKTDVISNGFDPDDFEGLQPSSPDIFTISYVGTLSDSYNIEGLLKSLREIAKEGRPVRLRFTGFVSAEQKKKILDYLPAETVTFREYCNHTGAIREMLDSSVLLLLIPDHRSNKVILTGKLFEYIATGKPILCIGPTDGDAASRISSLENSITAGYIDVSVITDFILKAMNGRYPEGQYLPDKFSGKEGARIYSELI